MGKSLFKKFNFGSGEIVALDVSSKNLTAIIGLVKAKKLISIKQLKTETYSGYAEGEWLNVEELKENAVSVLKKAMQGCKIKKKILHVSVPAEFLAVAVKNVDVEYEHIHKLTDADFDYFYYKGDTYGDGDFVPVNASGISFSIDGESISWILLRAKTLRSCQGKFLISFAIKAILKSLTI